MARVRKSNKKGVVVKGNGPVTLAIGVLFGLVGIGALIWGIGNISKGGDSESWPATQGVVTASEVDVSSSGGSRRSTTYSADISFEYTVAGQLHCSDKVSFGEYGSSNRGHAAGICAEYPVGKAVEVFYNPADPGQAVLETGVSGVGYAFPIILGAGFSLFGGVALFAGTVLICRKRAKPTAEETDIGRCLDIPDDENPYR